MTEHSAVISDPLRIPVTAHRLQDGRIVVRAPGRQPMFFSTDEVQRLSDFASGRAHIQRYPADGVRAT